MDIVDFFGELGIIPVIAIDHAEDAVCLGKALLDGELPCVEITYRTEAAEESIRRISKELPEMRIGAGTVLSADQAEKAVSAGAQFVVSPGFDPELVDYCIMHGVPVFPGVATPSEIMMALHRGLKLLKYFPAEAIGGTAMLKAVSAPFSEVKFIPTGGISSKNLADYLSMPMVQACGGSWLAERRLIAARQFAKITDLAVEARNIVRQIRAESVQQ